MYLSLIIFAFLILFIFNYVKNSKRNFPPGPSGLPIVGYLPFLGKFPYKKFRDLGYKYGNIVGLHLGTTDVVILNDHQAIKEAYTNPHILDRPSNLFDFHAGGLGFSANNGSLWVAERRYCTKILKGIIEKSKWEENLDLEIKQFVKSLSGYRGEPLDISEILTASISNNMLSLMFGKRLIDSEELKTVVKAVKAINPLLNQSGAANFFPFLSWFIAKFSHYSLHQVIMDLDNFNKFIKEKVKQRKTSTDLDQQTFIDIYQKQVDLQKEKSMQCVFSEYNLIANVQGLIHAGSETTKTSMEWLFLAMASYPNIQQKIHEEICGVLGDEDKCQWSDRTKLPYTHATVIEAQRWRTIAPLGLAHKSSEETKLNDYTIPKGTCVVANIWAMHNDDKYWKNPHHFIPERFLSDDGSISTKTESFYPFSAGRRKCPGESIAWVEIFKYFTTTLQNFQILPLEDCSPNLEGIPETTYHPQSQKLRFISRQQKNTKKRI